MEVKFGDPRMPKRFWDKVSVNPDTGCWEWTAGKSHDGYGRFWLDGARQYAHRLAYIEANGPIPGGMFIDHRCHNPACVSFSHLRLVTKKQNGEHRQGAQTNSKSGARGVYWKKDHGKWAAQVRHNGRCIHLGYFVNLTDAEAAVTSIRVKLFTHNDYDRA